MVGRTSFLFLATLFGLSIWPLQRGHAAGFAIDYESAIGIGLATAGSALAADASTIFYNPAGLGFLKQNEFLVGGQFLSLTQRFQNGNSTILGGALPTPGTNGGNAAPLALVPWIYASRHLTPELSAGVGIFSPFGLETDWGSTFYGRYQNELSSLTVIDVNPTLAYRPVKWLSVAAGPDVEYAQLKLTQAIDLGSACAGVLGLPTCGSAFNLAPGLSDGQGETHGDGWGFGFTVAALFEPLPSTRIGISYRSRIDLRFGHAQQNFSVSPGARAFLTLAGTPEALTGSPASTTLELPARLTFGLKHSLTEEVDLLMDVTLTFWDVFNSTSITAENSVTGASIVIPQGYRNAWRYAGGIQYRPDKIWTLRAGVAYDQTPIPAAMVMAAVPDRDRIYTSIGASYQPRNSRWNVDVAYSHLFAIGPVPINRTTSSGDTLNGQFRFAGDVFAAQFRYRY